jgi:glycolate oxidase iron-sulfur subunit
VAIEAVSARAGAGASRLAAELEEQRERLLPCVHCGFCLPACPTYNRLGDENDSPRGRLHLMKAVVEGRLDAGSDAFRTHIDRCLGCRACEPVCPSGVEYGTLLELARHTASEHAPQGLLTRALLMVMASRALRAALFLGGRVLRASGLAALGARMLPGGRVLGSARFGLAMLAATAPWRPSGGSARGAARTSAAGGGATDGAPRGAGRRVAVLTGCVQEGLYGRINDATRRTLEANGFQVVHVARQDCCGALHAHGGDLDRARALAKANIDAFSASGVDLVVVNAAGCGAAMKQYGTLLSSDGEYHTRASAFASRVRDATELLAEVGPRRGESVECSVAYDHPCHLLHAQRISKAPLQVLGAVPGIEVRMIANADECCGGAGIYGITHPDLGGRIGRDKVAAVRAVGAEVAATPNPGCMMQIGAGLILEGAREGVVHPVELLDESYRRAGYYEGSSPAR